MDSFFNKEQTKATPAFNDSINLTNENFSGTVTGIQPILETIRQNTSSSHEISEKTLVIESSPGPLPAALNCNDILGTPNNDCDIGTLIKPIS